MLACKTVERGMHPCRGEAMLVDKTVGRGTMSLGPGLSETRAGERWLRQWGEGMLADKDSGERGA